MVDREELEKAALSLVQERKGNPYHDPHTGEFGSGDSSDSGNSISNAPGSGGPADVEKIAYVSSDLNARATQISRDGDVPYFENYVDAVVGGKTKTFTYEGPFGYSEPQDNGTRLAVHYNHGVTTKFRADQLENISLQ